MAKRKILKTTTDVISPEGEITSTTVESQLWDTYGDEAFIKVYKSCTRRFMENIDGMQTVRMRLVWWFMDQLQSKPFGRLHIYALTSDLATRLKCSECAIKVAKAYLLKEGFIFNHRGASGQIMRNYYLLNEKYIHKGVIVMKASEQ